MLGSDFWPHGEVSLSYDVLRPADPFAGASERAIFVIDKEGAITFRKVFTLTQSPDLDETLQVLRRP